MNFKDLNHQIKNTKNWLFVYFFCPTCDQVAGVYAGDLAVDGQGSVVNVYPWGGTPNDLTTANWRNFTRRPPGNSLALLF